MKEQTDLRKVAQPDEAQVQAWKAQYKRIKHIHVTVDLSVYGEDGTEEYDFYFKPVDRNVKSLADKKLLDENHKVNADAYNETIIVGHLLNGHDFFQNDSDVRYALVSQADKIVTAGVATLVKK